MPLSQKVTYGTFIIFLCVLTLAGSKHIYPVEASSPATAFPSRPTLERAREVLSGYHLDPRLIIESREITEQVLGKDPQNIEALNFLSRVLLTQGYVLERTKDAKIATYEKGKEVAKRAVELAPDNPDAHFFYVSNLALAGQTRGVLNSLFMLPEIRREVDLILELDPNHAYGLGMQGALYYYLPSLLGGDLKISELYLRRSLSVNPHLSSTRLYLAMNLMKQEKYDEAAVELITLTNDSEPEFYPDWYLNRKFALALLKDIKRMRNRKSEK